MIYYALKHKPTGKLLTVQTDIAVWSEDEFLVNYKEEFSLNISSLSDPLYLVLERNDAEDVLASKYSWSEYRLPKLGGISPKDIEIVKVGIVMLPKE